MVMVHLLRVPHSNWKKGKKGKKRLEQAQSDCHTLLKGATEKRPMKLTAKRNGIIHLREGSLMFSGVFPFSDWAAITALIPNR